MCEFLLSSRWVLLLALLLLLLLFSIITTVANIPLSLYLSYPMWAALSLILIILRSPLAHQIVSLDEGLQEGLESCQSNVFPAAKP